MVATLTVTGPAWGAAYLAGVVVLLRVLAWLPGPALTWLLERAVGFYVSRWKVEVA